MSRDTDLLQAMEQTWPAAEYLQAGAFRVGRGLGGGRRVSAAVADGQDWDAADIALASEAQAAWDQPSLFRACPGDELSGWLLENGWRAEAKTHLLVNSVASLTDQNIPPVTTFAVWPPLAIQRELWTGQGIGPARQAVMERVAGPKIALLGRTDDRAAGVAFAATAMGVAFIHALEVLPALRRRGLAGWMIREIAFWAAAQGCDRLALAVTAENAPALALYDRLGFRAAGSYEYYLR